MRIFVVIHPVTDQYRAVLTAGSRVDKCINRSPISFIPKDGFLLIHKFMTLHHRFCLHIIRFIPPEVADDLQINQSISC